MNTMTATWLRVRMKYFGGIRLSRILSVFVFLTIAYIGYRRFLPAKPGIIHYKEVHINHEMSPREIDDYIYALQDTRPEACRMDYSDFIRKAKPKISIIVDYHNTEFYNLKLTLESILKHTPSDMYHEIVLLDDGSDHTAVMNHASDMLQGDKFHKLRAYRSDDHHGRGLTRFKASHVAVGDILVFVSSDVVVNVGWLEPLVAAVLEDSSRIIVPHQDNFLENHRFFQMDDNLVTTFSWTLSTVYMETTDDGNLRRTPVMRGEVFAVTKSFLDSIGNYDDGLKEGGGNDLELSLRTWMCGGEILTSICSRVATHAALKPHVITSDFNYIRIVHQWLGDHQELAFKQGKIHPEFGADENLNLKIRQGHLKNQNMKCQTIDWYLENVATNIVIPSGDMVHYGKLRVSSAYCIQISKAMENEVNLVLCRPYLYDPSMSFTFDSSGMLRKGNLCLMGSTATSKVILSECLKDNKLQGWSYQDTGLISSLAFPGSCLTHVTERSREMQTHLHYIYLTACNSVDSEKQTWTFVNF